MIYTHTFPNGFRVIYETPQNSNPISAIQVFCEVGSAMETDDVRGISHMVEHMIFKGTKKILSSEDIFKIFDEIGAYINAKTEKSYTNYQIKCHDDYVKKCIIELSDMLLNSVFKRAEFEKEKKVVVEENFRLEDNNNARIEDMYDASIYKGSSYQYSVDILAYHGENTLQHEQVIKFYKMFYRPENMVLSIITHMPFSKVIDIIKRSEFVTQINETHPIRLPKPIMDYAIQTEPQYIMQTRAGLNEVKLIVVFRTCSQYSPDKYALNLLSNVLGGYMGARLFTILREKNGLTYSSFCDTCYYSILGDFSIFSETDPNKLLLNKGVGKGVLPLIMDIIRDLQKNGVGKSELEVSKHNLRGSMALEEEMNENACFYNGSKLILYDEEHITPYKKRYDTHYKHITQRDIHDVIKRYLVKSNMTVCLLGKHIPNIKKIKEVCEIID
jgi:predicted Zn-dependent peptidase